MQVKQIYGLVNDTVAEVLGKESDLLTEDLSNVVDVGNSILNAGTDNYVKSLINRIGKTIIVSKDYQGKTLGLLKDGFEYGCILQKIRINMPDASENEAWKLNNGTSYDFTVFYGASVKQSFWQQKSTFEIDMSIAEDQVKESFVSANALTSFVAAIYQAMANKMSLALENLAQRVVNMAIAETLYDLSSTGDYTGAGNTRAINVLKLYNDKFNKSLTTADALFDADFIRYTAWLMGEYKDRLAKMSELFNLDGYATFTKDARVVLWSPFKNSADTYLYSDVYHNEFVRLPNCETVAYWQGVGDDFDLDITGTILCKDSAGHEIEGPDAILGVMFDNEALAICNENQRTTSAFNPKGEFTNVFEKSDMSAYFDKAENFVVFYCADASANA